MIKNIKQLTSKKEMKEEE